MVTTRRCSRHSRSSRRDRRLRCAARRSISASRSIHERLRTIALVRFPARGGRKRAPPRSVTLSSVRRQPRHRAVGYCRLHRRRRRTSLNANHVHSSRDRKGGRSYRRVDAIVRLLPISLPRRRFSRPCRSAGEAEPDQSVQRPKTGDFCSAVLPKPMPGSRMTRPVQSPAAMPSCAIFEIGQDRIDDRPVDCVPF